MNVLEQLKAMGFDEEPLQFYDGGEGGGGDPSGGDVGSGGGEGPGGTDVSSEISVDYGGTGPSVGDTVGQGAVSGPSSPYGGPQSIDNAQVAAAISPTVALATELATSPEQAFSLTVEALNDLGFGAVTGFNAANPTQSIAEMQAAQNVASGIQNIVVPALMAVVPGANTAMALGKGIAGLASGQISIGQSIANTAISLAASQMGLPVGTVTAMLNGNLGQAAANTAVGALNSAISSLTGIPAGIVGLGMNISGAGQFANQAISGAVNQATGATPANNVAAIGQAIDSALGTSSGATSGFGYGFDSAGQPAFDFSGGAGAADTSSSPASSAAPASSSMGALGAIGALGALGFQEQETPEGYQTAQVPVTSPFGLMYGMRG